MQSDFENSILALDSVLGLRTANLKHRVSPAPPQHFNNGSSMQMLWLGARGPVVKRLQARLRDLDLYHGQLDGSFGGRTEESVIQFQRTHGLRVDGYAGPKTLAALGLQSPSPSPGPAQRSLVFISYSHEDTKWLEQLRVHLAPLERQGLISRWDDALITPGAQWRAEIAAGLAKAKVAVLLLSPNFMASRFIHDVELPALITASQREGLAVVPVVVRPCLMGELAALQTVNPPNKPLVDQTQGDRDRTWIRVVEAITSALNADSAA